MKRHFCTYFDKNYLYRGLVLFNSMEKNFSNFILHILCMDDTTYNILKNMKLKSVNLIKISDFEDPKLQKAKTTRTIVEYYWTCTPSLLLYVLKENQDIDMITYLDSDLMFFSSPEKIFKEMGNKSILAIEHRFLKNAEELIKENGKYCVQFLTFRRNQTGMACLKRWRDQCLEWCSIDKVDGLVGDQGYLNEWDSLYKEEMCSSQDIGAGLAPWNINNYKLSKNKDKVFVGDHQLCFYHYHAMRIYSRSIIDPAEWYTFSRKQLSLIYKPYFVELRKSMHQVDKIQPGFKHGFTEGIFIRFLINGLAKRGKNALRTLCNLQ